MSDDPEKFTIEVTYASETKQFLKSLQVTRGTVVIDAIRQSGVSDEFPDLDIESARLGIFSKFIERDTKLNEHDRIEIYRPLRIDPKEARRHRAQRRNGSRAKSQAKKGT